MKTLTTALALGLSLSYGTAFAFENVGAEDYANTASYLQTATHYLDGYDRLEQDQNKNAASTYDVYYGPDLYYGN